MRLFEEFGKWLASNRRMASRVSTGAQPGATSSPNHAMLSERLRRTPLKSESAFIGLSGRRTWRERISGRALAHLIGEFVQTDEDALVELEAMLTDRIKQSTRDEKADD
jgi:hypothetical protein